MQKRTEDDVLRVVRAREAAQVTGSDEDYGFWNDPDVVKAFYWKQRNAQGGLLPDIGGWFDQDERFDQDVNTYAWLVGLAESVVAKEKEEAAKAKAERDKALKGMGL